MYFLILWGKKPRHYFSGVDLAAQQSYDASIRNSLFSADKIYFR